MRNLPNRLTTAEAVEHIISKVVPSISGQLIALALMIWVFDSFDGVNTTVILWTLLIVVVLSSRYPIYKKIHALNKPPLSQEIDSALLNQFHLNVFTTGVAWGLGFYYFTLNAPDQLHLLVMAIAAMLGGAGVLTLASSFFAYALFAIPMISLLGLSYFAIGTDFHVVAAIATLIGMTYLLYTAHDYSQKFTNICKNTSRLEQTQLDLIYALGRAAEYRDEETSNHTLRMSNACYLVALELGYSEENARRLQKASTMHDIGKIGISDQILLKPGKLSEQERMIMQTHTEIGLSILEESDSLTIQMARIIIGGHHERWDGQGYPNRLAGETIPMEARIAAVCDVFDALISERPYKRAWPFEKALEYIENNRGKHFDPKVADAFINSYAKIVAYDKSHADETQSDGRMNRIN